MKYIFHFKYTVKTFIYIIQTPVTLILKAKNPHKIILPKSISFQISLKTKILNQSLKTKEIFISIIQKGKFSSKKKKKK
jgi:hypothetical protein